MQIMKRAGSRPSGTRVFLWPAVLTAMSLSGTGAHAQPAVTAVEQDTRCLLAMGALANNPKNRTMALLGVYYFAGRITAAEPGFDFSAGLKKAAATTTAEQVNTAAHECAAEVGRRAQALNAAQATLATAPPLPTK